MIPANHNAPAHVIFSVYVKWLLKRHFYALYVLGNIPRPDPHKPLILLPNHSTWWDGFFAYLLNEKFFRREFYVMMLEEQLRKNRFLSRIGAYSVNPENPVSTLRSLRYTWSLLQKDSRPAPLVCIFPQGELKPWALRPLDFRNGLEWIMSRQHSPVSVLPLAIRAEFTDQQRPAAFLMLGKVCEFNNDSFPGMQVLEHEFVQLLSRLEMKVIANEAFVPVLKGSSSINEKFIRFRERLFFRKRKSIQSENFLVSDEKTNAGNSTHFSDRYADNREAQVRNLNKQKV